MNPHGRACTEPATRRQGWRLTTREQRRLVRLLHYSPSLRSTVPTVMAESYPHARRKALEATEEPSTTFLETYPWTPEQMLDAEFWPEYGMQCLASLSSPYITCCLTLVHLASTQVGASNVAAGSGVNRVTEPEGVPLLLQALGQVNRRAPFFRFFRVRSLQAAPDTCETQ